MHAAPNRNASATISAGAWKGRRLRYPANVQVRPTMRRTKESLFSSLGAALEGAVFADLYAGAGAVGIEALSRGARMVHFVEAEREAVQMLFWNLTACGADPSRYSVHQARVADVLASAARPIQEATIVFADPPYSVDASADLLARLRPGVLPALGMLVVEHRAKSPLSAPGNLRLDRERRFGDTMLSYLVPAAGGSGEGDSA